VIELFRSKTREEWRAFNDEHDCCVEPVLDLDEALDSDHAKAREMVVELEQPELGTVRQLGFPVKMSRTPADIHRHAPALGEHTAELLGEAGYSDEEIAAMEEKGAAKGPDAEQGAEAFMA
jgi:crotonobetainyl-CoA:carnitine CoA-transferase CaiB-like acyl-CoA transferase